jgi:hypothetical protein
VVVLEAIDANRSYSATWKVERWVDWVMVDGRDQNNNREEQLSARVTGWAFWGREENGNSKLT